MAVDNGIPGTQYLTWGLVVGSWIVTIVVARFVLRKNARNTWIADIKKALTELEDDAIKFWMGENDENEVLDLNKLRRKIKDITTLAMEIRSYGGAEYPNQLFIHLRRQVTTEKYHPDDKDSLKRKLPADDMRISEISEACSDLRNTYRRIK
ncbi:hypothetical protein WKH25_07425 [Pantoea agglomerans]|uniref:hypothetical protein n=1 Tax=Enterobacter agglomerans TaxID=549 RepID=UPI003C7BBBA7